MERVLVRCRACGYIVNQDKLKDVCPACGLPKTVFEPYKDNVSGKRNAFINLHLHPIAVHFPQAFAVVIIPLILLGEIPGLSYGRDLLVTAKVLSGLLPFLSLLAFLAGLIDAQVRFKKLRTPALKTKMIFGGLFFIMNCLIAAIVFQHGFETKAVSAVIALLVLCVGCQIVLGNIGVKLMGARLGG
jgi:hypothetical protein